MLIAVGLVVVVLLTLATGYFVAQEFAYVSVDRNRLRQLADEGDAAAARALDITARLSFTLSGAQFGITVTALLVGYAAEPLIGVGAGRPARPRRSRMRPASPSPSRRAACSRPSCRWSSASSRRRTSPSPAPIPLARSLSRSTLALPRGRRTARPPLRPASNRLLRAVGIEPVEEL